MAQKTAPPLSNALGQIKMYCKDKTHLLAVYIVIIAFMVTGCATTSTSLKFTQSEVKLIPAIAIQKVLSPGSMNETVMVRARSFLATAEVKGFEGLNYVIVMDERHGNEMKLVISEITEIERIRQIKRPDTSAGKHQGDTAEAIGETLIYAPLIPVAIASWPFLRAMGLDEEKNSTDTEKALLIFGGLTKKALRENIGEPTQRYLCKREDSRDMFEVWSYEKDQVLRGGRFLFLSPDEGKVYFTSFRFPSWANCSLATD